MCSGTSRKFTVVNTVPAIAPIATQTNSNRSRTSCFTTTETGRSRMFLRSVASRVPRGTRDATLLRNIRERPVSVVVKHEVRDRFELVWVAIGAIAGTVFTTVNFREVPLHITTDDQIEPPIAVVVNEARARAPSAAAHACLGRNIGEGAVAVVVIKNISTKVRH